MENKNSFCRRNKLLESYIVGLAIGDGNLSNPSGRATRLRITCDKKYPLLIQRIVDSLGLLFSKNKVSIVDREKNYLDISVYSNQLEKIIPWRAGKGSKFAQCVSVPEWIKQKNKYTINCLKGLLETDGSVYDDRGYKMALFTTIIPKLAKDVNEMIFSLGFNPHTYQINQTNKQKLYHVRLSKKVLEFLNIVKVEKN